MSSRRRQALHSNYRFRLKYETLRTLLNRNNQALQLLSDLEADLRHLRHSSEQVREQVYRILEECLMMAQECNLLTGNRHKQLYDVIFDITASTDQLFSTKEHKVEHPLVLSLDHEAALDPALTGGKASGVASLTRMLGNRVPPGFVVTTEAYRLLLRENQLEARIRLMLNDIEATADNERFSTLTRLVRHWLGKARIPREIAESIRQHVQTARYSVESGWAVRSSAVQEDGPFSFAGLFESQLFVPPEDLFEAYLKVLASRFLDRAVLYRIHRGIREVDTPMAVLFMPMVEPVASGVLYTMEPADPSSDTMIINTVRGTGDRVVHGKASTDTITLSREQSPRLMGFEPASPQETAQDHPDYISREVLLQLGATAWQLREKAGHDLDIEWAIGKDGEIRFLQARRMDPRPSVERRRARHSKDLPAIEGGITISPGRAEGRLYNMGPRDRPEAVPRGAVLLVRQPHPELSPALTRIAALLATQGNPVAHMATLAREYAVPSIFQLGASASRLKPGQILSVDATSRRIYMGSRWPGMKERTLARISESGRVPRSGPLHDLILALNLTDPDSPGFKAKKCLSVHDTLRFMHEMSVQAMFAFGDRQKGFWNRRSIRLDATIPMKFHVIVLDASHRAPGRSLLPQAIESAPFHALWAGFTDGRLQWPQRWQQQMAGLPRDFQETVMGGLRGPRRASDTNYLMVARDYLNLNARFTYHYSMLDAMVGPGTENNHLYFSFRGGGGALEPRTRRARFLEQVLRRSRFDVVRRTDNVIAWFRRYPADDSLEMLTLIGRLLVCARELDALLKTDKAAIDYADDFLHERYSVFS